MFQSKLGFVPLLGMVFLFGISILCQAQENSEKAAHRAAAGAEKPSQGSVPGTHPPKVEITDESVKILGIQETEASQRSIPQVAASSVNPQELERLRAHAVENVGPLQKATTELFDAKRRLIEADQVDQAADLAAQKAFEKYGRDHVLFKEANEAADRAAQLRAEKALEFRRVEEVYETALDGYKKAQSLYAEARYGAQFASLERRIANRAAELERQVVAEAAQVEAEATKYFPKDVAGIKAAEAVKMAEAGSIPLANAARTLERGIVEEAAKISSIGHVLGSRLVDFGKGIVKIGNKVKSAGRFIWGAFRWGGRVVLVYAVIDGGLTTYAVAEDLQTGKPDAAATKAFEYAFPGLLGLAEKPGPMSTYQKPPRDLNVDGEGLLISPEEIEHLKHANPKQPLPLGYSYDFNTEKIVDGEGLDTGLDPALYDLQSHH